MEHILLLSTDSLFNERIKRSVPQYTLVHMTEDVNVNVFQRFYKQYHPSVFLIHQSGHGHNLNGLLSYLLTNKVIPIIYIHKVSNYGSFIQYLSDPLFFNMEENKVDFLESTIHIYQKVGLEIRKMAQKIQQLEEKIAEESWVKKAKIVLMEKHQWSEEEAHKYIQKQSMDQRVSKEKIAKEILENN